MGCASSKTTPPRCRHCQKSYSSPEISRSYSMHVHHLPQNRGDSYHVVALTSSTLGSLNNNRIEYEIKTIANELDHHIDMLKKETTKVQDLEEVEKVKENENTKEFSMGLIEAKTWSNMINQKIPKIIPKTPTRTPPGEPEMINAWELMEGLEDTSPVRYSSHHLRSFSFDVVKEPCPVSDSGCIVDRPKSRFSVASPQQKQPMWLQCEKENLNSNLQFDPEVISGFRKSFEELKNDDPFHFSEVDPRKQQHLEEDYLPFSDDKKEVVSVLSDYECEVVPFGKGKDREKVVLYFTSLRGVRKTYEDCCHVRVILKGLGVRVDERDVSMHSGFKEELKELVNVVSLPKVFLGDKCIGGVEEIRQLHEEGKLEKLLESCEKLSDGCGGGGGVCDACGDIRFVPCETCSGSCKIYYEDEDHDQEESDEGREEEEEEEEEEAAKEGEGGFQRCPDCNENGLIRCPICCY